MREAERMPKSTGHRERLLTSTEQAEQRRLFTIALPHSWRAALQRVAARRKLSQSDVLIELLAPHLRSMQVAEDSPRG